MKKKILILVLTLIAAISLVACGTSKNVQKLEEASKLLVVPTEVIDSFQVDAKAGDASVSWVSSNTAVLSVGATADGKVAITVTRPSAETEVSLTATLTIEKDKLDKVFKVKVLLGDTTAPVISGTKDFELALNSEKPNWLEGVTATDAVDGSVTVSVDDSKVKLDEVGQYDLVYTAKDSSNNVASVIVKVLVGDVTAPIIRGYALFYYTIGDAKPNWLEGVTATDNVDGTLTVTVDDSDVVLTEEGTYELVYSATDKAGNTTESTTKVFVSNTVNAALASVRLPEKTGTNLTLPTTISGITVTWASSNPTQIATDGKVTRPVGQSLGVKLSATAIKGDDQAIREFWVLVHGTDYNTDGTYKSSFGEIVTLNPLMSTGNSDSAVYEFLVAPLYSGDYDWGKAITDGFASFPGDFSKIKSDRNPSGTVEMPSIAYKRTLGMASAYPYAVNAGTRNAVTGSYGQELDNAAAKATLDNEWIIELRDDLKFADGTKITADTFEYTFKQYLNGKLANERANYLYTEDYVPLTNAKLYYDGKTTWDQVGYEKIDELTFKLYLSVEVTQYDFMGSLSIINLVHEKSFEDGFNAAGTANDYGSVQNPLVSYGPYVLNNDYDVTNKFIFTRNQRYYAEWDYSIKTIEGPIIKDQQQIINEFKVGNLDVAGVGGEFWEEYQEHKNLYVSPSDSFYRIAISLDRSGGSSGKSSSPILKYDDFRRALYLATDRGEFADTVQPPSEGALGFLSNIHQVSEWASQAYSKSDAYQQQLQQLGLKPEDHGFDSAEAKTLFDKAYADAVAAGDYKQGDNVVVEFSYYDAGSNTRIANWVKAQYEEVFGANFEIRLVALSSAELTAQRNAGDFDLVFTGMSGATFQATFGMGYIFSPTFSTFLVGKGHDVPNLPVTATITNLFDIIAAKDASERTKSEQAFYNALEATDGEFEGGFDELFLIYYNTPELDVDYDGQEEDLTNITVALETALLKQMVAVPLFSSTSAAVYSDRVVRLAHAYHLFLGWGGLTYTYIKA